MRIADGRYHLTYCTNVHPGRDWSETRAGLEQYLPPLKAGFAPDALFGVGLRLSGLASSQLLEGDELAWLRADLDAWGCYVYTMNGFPLRTLPRRDGQGQRPRAGLAGRRARRLHAAAGRRPRRAAA